MKEPNKYFSATKRQSYIFNPSPLTPSNTQLPVIAGSRVNLEQHKLLNLGNTTGEHKGYYLASDGKSWRPGEMTRQQNKLEELEQKFQQHQKDLQAMGRKKTKIWPPELLAEKEKTKAKILVLHEELKYLDDLLADVEKVEKREREHRGERILGPVKSWRREEYVNGCLVSVGGQRLSKDKHGDLYINEPSSPFHKMSCARWKDEIIRVIFWEKSYRDRVMLKRLLHERERVPWPAPPIYFPKSESIEYPGYSDHVIAKLNRKNKTA